MCCVSVDGDSQTERTLYLESIRPVNSRDRRLHGDAVVDGILRLGQWATNTFTDEYIRHIEGNQQSLRRPSEFQQQRDGGTSTREV